LMRPATGRTQPPEAVPASMRPRVPPLPWRKCARNRPRRGEEERSGTSRPVPPPLLPLLRALFHGCGIRFPSGIGDISRMFSGRARHPPPPPQKQLPIISICPTIILRRQVSCPFQKRTCNPLGKPLLFALPFLRDPSGGQRPCCNHQTDTYRSCIEIPNSQKSFSE